MKDRLNYKLIWSVLGAYIIILLWDIIRGYKYEFY